MKTVNLKLPAPLKKYISATQVEFDGHSIHELFQLLDERYGSVKERLLDDDGAIRPYINIFVGKENIRDGQGLNTKVNNNDQVSILLSFAGG